MISLVLSWESLRGRLWDPWAPEFHYSGHPFKKHRFYQAISLNLDDFRPGRLWDPWGAYFPDSGHPFKKHRFYKAISLNFDDFRPGRLWDPWGAYFPESGPPLKNHRFYEAISLNFDDSGHPLATYKKHSKSTFPVSWQGGIDRQNILLRPNFPGPPNQDNS